MLDATRIKQCLDQDAEDVRLSPEPLLGVLVFAPLHDVSQHAFGVEAELAVDNLLLLG
jgi:hypothetical protein